MSEGEHVRGGASAHGTTRGTALAARVRSGLGRTVGRRPRRPGSRAWRVGTPVVLILCGSLLAVSAARSQGTDLRPGRYPDVASLVRAESQSYEALRQRVQDLNGQVAELAAGVDDPEVARLQQRTERLRSPAGLAPVRGPGVTVTLSDSPLEVDRESGIDERWFVVHQQDVQAVVNAMWRGGATAVTIQGQRVVTTTAIKCEGNSITIQGVPYPQPYVISAVGDQASLEGALTSDSYVRGYVQQSQDPAVRIGWGMRRDEVRAPAYDDVLRLSYAKPVA